MPPIKGESKQGLVVTLVFFILATIGLGVSTYYGMSEQEKLKQDKLKEVAKVKIADDERDYFRLQSAIWRSYLGAPPAAGSPAASELTKKPRSTMARTLPPSTPRITPRPRGCWTSWPRITRSCAGMAPPTNRRPTSSPCSRRARPRSRTSRTS